MADVLLGRSEGIEGFERHVVLKRIRPEHARDKRFIRMFLDEARVAANLHHQHIVQVHDVGEAGGEYFIAMEYIHGEDVRMLLSTASKARAHVPLGYAIMIVSAAAAGLHYAHERRGPDKRSLGIVHRDISPSNILVGYDGSIKVVDFGIAKATMRPETRSGTLKGKASYMSPEQCKSDDIDRRSDVYSLGVVLYELATTTRLFRGENDYLVMDQIVNGRLSLPRVRRPDLPNELSAIIMRAIATDPERRYFTADELRVALDHFAAKAGLTASPSSLAAYMCKQFGERPEPWLELKGQVVNSLDEVPTTVGQGRAQSWTELPRADDIARHSSGAIARPSGAIRTSASASASEPAEAASAGDDAAGPDAAGPDAPETHDALDAADDIQRISAERSLLTPSPTDARMGWESQRRTASGLRGITPAKVAMLCVPLIVLLGIAVWRLAGTGTTASPVAAVATQPAAPVEAAPPPPPPVVTPIPDPPRQEPAPEPAPPAPPPKAVVRVEAPPLSKRASAKKAPAAKITEPATAKPDSSIASGASPGPATSPAAAPPQSLLASAQGVSTAAVRSLSPSASAPSATPAASAGVPPASGTVPTASASTPPASATTPPASATTPPASVAAAGTPAGPATADSAAEGPAQIAHTVVEHVASAHLRELSKCDSEDMHGEIAVKFIVDGSGKVTKAQLATAVKKHKLAACILRSVQKWQFPRQGPTGAQGTYTLSFQ
jgi:serine/threonine protein kinase